MMRIDGPERATVRFGGHPVRVLEVRALQRTGFEGVRTSLRQGMRQIPGISEKGGNP